jgi:cytoskeletal protein CcmA (bactofilin family)
VNANFSALSTNALNRSGGTITGNIAVDNGITIDGVDVGSILGGSGTLTLSSLTLTTLTCTGCVGATQLAATAVSASSYGSASSVGTFTVDADGRLTTAASVSIQVAETAITDGSLLARVGDAETISGAWTFSASPVVSLAVPYVVLDETDQSADGRKWLTIGVGGEWQLRAYNDALNSSNTAIRVARSGTTISAMELTAALIGFSGPVETSSTLDVGGNLTVTGDIDVTGTLTGDISVTDLTVSGNALLVLPNGSTAPAIMRLYHRDIAETDYGCLWVSTANQLRIQLNSCPTSNDTSLGGVVGDQTSNRASKNLLDGTPADEELLNIVLSTQLHRFTYKDGRYNGEIFLGIVTDESPWFGMDNGKSLNPINGLGYMVGALRAVHSEVHVLEEQNKILQARIELLEATSSSRRAP